ncbi:MAG: hypothetical protein MUC51_10815 [Anaerolineae bacterium]|nr:hypothetical protein [Anaerolineae bacterium]
MEQRVRKAEPEYLISQPRVQEVEGFHYLYAERLHIHETEVGKALDAAIRMLTSTWERIFEEAPSPPMLIMFHDLDEEKMYDVQAGFVVPPGTPPQGETQIRFVPPALVAGMLVWGDISAVAKSYAPLMTFMDTHGLTCIEGWREWRLLFEGETSMSNVTWVQHVAKEKYD